MKHPLALSHTGRKAGEGSHSMAPEEEDGWRGSLLTQPHSGTPAPVLRTLKSDSTASLVSGPGQQMAMVPSFPPALASPPELPSTWVGRHSKCTCVSVYVVKAQVTHAQVTQGSMATYCLCEFWASDFTFLSCPHSLATAQKTIHEEDFVLGA